MSQGNQDFLRQLPDSTKHFGRGIGFFDRFHLDPILFILISTLIVFGLFMLYSASGQNEYMVRRQATFYAIAYGVLFFTAQIDVKILQRWAGWIYLGGLVLLVLVLLIGVGAKGAQRWISLGVVRFQPSEILKFAVPIAVAAFLSARALPPKIQHIIVSLGIIFVPVVLIFKQPDLGTSILVGASGIITLFLAGLSWRFIFGSLAAALAALWPMWLFVMKDYQKQRVMTLLDPEADRLGSGWNIIQSKTAIGSGGWSGKGYLQGTQSQLDFLPESHTDFIIAVLAEEFGFVGVVALLLLYVCIIARGLIIAAKAHNTFSRLLAGSLTLTFFIYVLVNVGMVSGVLPVVGVPLPLVSLGGTSVVTMLLGFGILMAVSTQKKS